MPSFTSSLFSLLLTVSALTSQVLAIPAAGSPTITSPPSSSSSLVKRQVSYNSAATEASLAAVSAAQAYSAAQSYSADAVSESAYYATATEDDAYAAAPAPTGPDQCGPKTPDPRVPDTCESYVEMVQAPAPYGVQCLNDGSKPALNVSSCAELIPIMCTNQFQHAGEWVWATQEGCSLGSFLPGKDIPDQASWPPQVNCEELIYGSMLVACTGGGTSYNVAAVNLQQLPSNNPGGRGQAVNAAYGSYIIAEEQPRIKNDVPGQEDTGAAPASINVPSIVSVVDAQYATAFSSESALLATMTGTAAAEALSDLLAYQTAVPDPNAGEAEYGN